MPHAVFAWSAAALITSLARSLQNVSPIPTCAAFKEYEEVPETVPLDFTEDDVMWVVSELSGTASVLGAEAVELRNWILRFGCALEEMRFVVSRLAGCMDNYPPPTPPGPHIAH